VKVNHVMACIMGEHVVGNWL